MSTLSALIRQQINSQDKNSVNVRHYRILDYSVVRREHLKRYIKINMNVGSWAFMKLDDAELKETKKAFGKQLGLIVRSYVQARKSLDHFKAISKAVEILQLICSVYKKDMDAYNLIYFLEASMPYETVQIVGTAKNHPFFEHINRFFNNDLTVQLNYFKHLPAFEIGAESLGKLTVTQGTSSKPRIKLSVGKVIKRIAPWAGDSVVQKATEAWNLRFAPPIILWAESGADICNVYKYETSFRSCMTGTASVAAYDTGDGNIRLAYITEDNQPQGRVSARCLVRMDRKEYIRNYGDNRLEQLLMKEGFKAGNLTDAKLRIVYSRNKDYLYAPYIDYGNLRHSGAQRVVWNDGEDIGTIGVEAEEGQLWAMCSSACSEAVVHRVLPKLRCDCCGSRFDREYLRGISVGEDEGHLVCEDCLDNNYAYGFYNSYDEGYFRQEELTQLAGNSGFTPVHISHARSVGMLLSRDYIVSDAFYESIGRYADFEIEDFEVYGATSKIVLTEIGYILARHGVLIESITNEKGLRDYVKTKVRGERNQDLQYVFIETLTELKEEFEETTQGEENE